MDPKGKANILVLDDDYANMRLCRHVLEQAGYAVTATVNPHEAIQQLKNATFDLVVTDIRMPGIDGYEIATMVKQIDPNTAIIFITGYGTADTAVQALQRGVDGLLLKPLGTVGELTSTVTRILEDRRNKQDANRLKALRPLFDLTEQMFLVNSHQQLCDMVINIAKDMFHFELSGIYRHDSVSNSWESIAGTDLNSLVRLNQSVFDRIFNLATTDTLRIVKNEHIGQGQLGGWLAGKEWLGLFIPVRHTNSKYIFYGLRSIKLGNFLELDEEMMAIITRQAAVALENTRLYASLRKSLQQIEESQAELALSEKMAALGRLMASLAHEINNPLQAISNCLHLAGRQDLAEDQRDGYYKLAIKEIERLSNLAQRTLEYYRPKDLKRQKVNLTIVLDQSLNLVEPRLNRVKAEVNLEGVKKSVMAEVFPDQIQQVFLNLLINAIDSMEECEKEPILWIELEETRNKIMITVEDNGRGIPSEHEGQLFEPFFTTKPLGSGQGLPICYHLVVNLHQGEIGFVKPIHGTGARIRVILPGRA